MDHTASSIAGVQVASSAKRAGMVAIVKSSIATSGSSSQVTGADTRPTGEPRTKTPRRSCGLGRLVVVEEDRLVRALLLPPARRHLLRHAPLNLAANASAARRTSRNPNVGSMRTYTCTPFEPDSWASRRRRARRAPRARSRPTAWHSANPAAGPGSRSMRHSSASRVGPARVPRVELDRRHLDGPRDVGQLRHAQLVAVRPEGTSPRRSRATRAAPLGTRFGRSSRRRCRSGTDAACTAARAPRADAVRTDR